MSISCYFAAPLFTESERAFNLATADALEQHARVYLPQRDGYLLRDLLRGGADLEAARRVVFRADLAAIDAADVVLAVLDGPAVDDGVAVELGYAYANGKVCIGLQTDSRRDEGFFRNPMWHGVLSATFNDARTAIGWVSELARASSIPRVVSSR